MTTGVKEAPPRRGCSGEQPLRVGERGGLTTKQSTRRHFAP